MAEGMEGGEDVSGEDRRNDGARPARGRVAPQVLSPVFNEPGGNSGLQGLVVLHLPGTAPLVCRDYGEVDGGQLDSCYRTGQGIRDYIVRSPDVADVCRELGDERQVAGLPRGPVRILSQGKHQGLVVGEYGERAPLEIVPKVLGGKVHPEELPVKRGVFDLGR